MFRTEKSVRVLQAVAAIAGLAVLLWSLGLPSIRFADAANVTDFSDTLSDSATSTVAYHEIEYVIPTGSAGVEVTESIDITFPAEFTGTSSVVLADLDLEINGIDQTVVDPAAAANQWDWSWAGNTLSFTSGGGNATATANATVTIQIGSNAAGGTDRLVNPSTAASYEIDLVSGDGDSDTGSTRVVILAPVKITASVDTTFSFTVAGLGGGETVNGTTTTGTTTATTIPFGELQAGGANATTSAQRLSVTTNASQGYVVTMQVDDTLISSTGANIDLFDEGSENDTPVAWSSPSGTIGSPNTYGHWGVTSGDTDTKARTGSEFTSDTWIAASTTPRVIMGHNGPADGAEAGTSQTEVGFKVQITSLQEAGDDYQAILTYIATPTF